MITTPIEDMPMTMMVAPTHLDAVHEFMAKWAGCVNCCFGVNGGRKVWFRGFIPSEVLFIGEAPGISEHSTGRPFVGNCGDVMDRIIYNAAAKSETSFHWCMANAVLCTPFDEGREFVTPKLPQLGPCSFRLMDFIRIVEPKLVVKVGTVAHRTFPKEVHYASRVDGSRIMVPSVDIYHPGWIVRQQDEVLAEKKITYALSQALGEHLGTPVSSSK